jgi:hypothetical protein
MLRLPSVEKSKSPKARRYFWRNGGFAETNQPYYQQQLLEPWTFPEVGLRKHTTLYRVIAV